MIEGLVDWVERVDQLTYDMQDMVDYLDDFMNTATLFGVFIGFAILVIFMIVIMDHAAVRRIEQKLNYMIGEDFEDYQENKKDYEIYT